MQLLNALLLPVARLSSNPSLLCLWLVKRCKFLQMVVRCGKLARITDSLDLYLAFVAPGQFGHEYVANLSAHSWVIRHQQCKRSASSETKKCEQCASLASDRSIVHNVSRLRSKVFAAHLLRSRLFGDEVETQALLQGRF